MIPGITNNNNAIQLSELNYRNSNNNKNPINFDYNQYNNTYNPPLDPQAKFNDPPTSTLGKPVEIIKNVGNAGGTASKLVTAGLVFGVAFTVASAIIGYSYWDTTLNPFFSSTLATILLAITTFTTNISTLNQQFYLLNITVSNLAKPNFTIAGDAYLTTFNGSAPLFNNSAPEVGSALNYLAANDLYFFNRFATLPPPQYAYTVPFNGSSPRFNTSAPTVGAALNYLADNENLLFLLIAQILATPPATANAYTTTFNGTNPLFNQSAPTVGVALNQLAANDNILFTAIAQILATPPATANAYTTTFNGSNPLFNQSAPTVGVALNQLAANDNILFTAIAQILATPPATANAYTTTYNGTSPNFVPSVGTVGAALDYLGTSNTLLRARKDLNYYISATYGSDVTGDGSRQLPFATLFRALQASANVTNQFAQISFIFDNGLYSESNYIPIKPNFLFVANEIGVLLIFAGGAGLDGGSWAATGTGYVSFLRFGLIRCDAVCDFDMATAVPSTSIFSVFKFYNSSIILNAPMNFRRRADTTSYFGVVMESVVSTGSTITMQDITAISWSLSGDTYSNLNIAYNSSSTYSSSTPTIAINGLVAYGTNTIVNSAFGITVDATILAYISKGSSTMTLVTSAGTGFNTHGDVLSYGVINGGILQTGAGTVGFQYLTMAIGLGVTTTVPAHWKTPHPVNQQEADDQFAKRIYDIEIQIKSEYHVNAWTQSGVLSSSPIQIGFTTGPEMIYGPDVFVRGASSITYNGTSTAGFTFTINFDADVQYNSGAFTQLITSFAFFINFVDVYDCYQITSVNGGGVTGGSTEPHTITCSKDIYLNSGDVITAMSWNFISGPTGFLARITTGGTSGINYFHFNQL